MNRNFTLEGAAKGGVNKNIRYRAAAFSDMPGNVIVPAEKYAELRYSLKRPLTGKAVNIGPPGDTRSQA
jgi:hypothetical protein